METTRPTELQQNYRTTAELQQNYRTTTELQQNYRTTTQVSVSSTGVIYHTTTAGGNLAVLSTSPSPGTSSNASLLSRATTVDVGTTISTTMPADCNCDCNALPLIILSATTAVGFFLWFLTLIIVVCWKRNVQKERQPRYKKESSSSNKLPQQPPPVRRAPTLEDSKRVNHQPETAIYSTRSSLKDMATEKPNNGDYDRPPGLKKEKTDEDAESVNTTGSPELDEEVYIRNETKPADNNSNTAEPPVVHNPNNQRFSKLLTSELKRRQNPIGSEGPPSNPEYEECNPIG